MEERRCTKGVKSEIGTKSRCKESWKRSQSMTSPDPCMHAVKKTQKVHFSGTGGGGVSLHLPSKNSEFFLLGIRIKYSKVNGVAANSSRILSIGRRTLLKFDVPLHEPAYHVQFPCFKNTRFPLSCVFQNKVLVVTNSGMSDTSPWIYISMCRIVPCITRRELHR